jgi:hypothetical protein
MLQGPIRPGKNESTIGVAAPLALIPSQTLDCPPRRIGDDGIGVCGPLPEDGQEALLPAVSHSDGEIAAEAAPFGAPDG